MESALKAYGRNLVGPLIARDDEIQRVITILSKRSKNNPLLIGEDTTAVVDGLAKQLVGDEAPSNLADWRLVKLDMGVLMASEGKYVGGLDERLMAVLKEVEAEEGNIILFIDEICILLGTSTYAANIFKAMLARCIGKLRCILATNLEEYKKYIEKESGVERQFEKVCVAEPTVVDTIHILRGLREEYEEYHGVTIQDSAIVLAAQISSSSRQDITEKAMNLIDEACADIRVQLNSKKPTETDNLRRNKEHDEASFNEEADDVITRVYKIKQRIKLTSELDKLKQRIDKLGGLKRKRNELQKQIQELDGSTKKRVEEKSKYSETKPPVGAEQIAEVAERIAKSNKSC